VAGLSVARPGARTLSGVPLGSTLSSLAPNIVESPN
jgi:hypothetical protein